MAGLLDLLMPNRAQQPDPWAGLRQAGQPSGGGFLNTLLAPEIALPMAAQLMGQQGNSANFGNALGAAGPAFAQRAQTRQESEQKNRTLEYLRANAPEYADMVANGMPVGEAWGAMLEARKAQKPNPTNDMQEYEYAKQQGFGGSFMDYMSARGGGRSDGRPASVVEYEYGRENPEYAEWMKTKGRDAPLTATDKKAILDADEMVLANQTTVDMLNSVIAEPQGPGTSLNDRAGYGWNAGSQAWLARNDPTGLFDDAKGEATTELENVVLGQALSNLKAIFGAAPTEGERKILVDLQASVDKTPQERRIIIQRAIDLANKRLSFNQDRANSLRGGDYYKAPNSAPAQPSGNGWTDVGNGVRIRRK